MICKECDKDTKGELNSRSRTDGISSVDIRVMRMVCARLLPSAWPKIKVTPEALGPRRNRISGERYYD